ncbi:MAG: hypothetical protein GY715_00010, partial [Planctomycetes bacterium]|nr:hypothetical protein [Planctomycetota bacterium]
MRFSGSIYDNLRQPGVLSALDRATGGDAARMRQAILARLRLDDLLSKDSIDDERPQLVESISNVLDGRLFTLLSPEDLAGLRLEVVCHQRFVRDPATAGLRIVRSWMQNESGQGRPGYFLAEPAGVPDHEVARAISKMKLDVTTWEKAADVLRDAGYGVEQSKRLVEHWTRWSQAIADGEVKLKP